MALQSQINPLVLSMGEPSSIAAEITAMAWQALRGDVSKCFCLVGDGAVLEARGRAAGIDVSFLAVDSLAASHVAFAKGVPVLQHAIPFPSIAEIGRAHV